VNDTEKIGLGEQITLADLNGLSREDFVRVAGPVFEHSPWIADAAWHHRPFADVHTLLLTLRNIVENAGEKSVLALVRAHPDLVGRAALAGTLTPESTREQAGAGLNQMGANEAGLFQQLNAAYHAKFNFPFIICARLNKKAAILNGLEQRLKNSRHEELKTALEEVFKIAELRLRDLIAD
jgi:OHCU decarboxylase